MTTPPLSRTPVLGVSACIFRADSVLLVERARSPFQGLLSLPGGRVEFGEHLEAAIRREVLEETGLTIAGFAFHCLHEAIEPDVHVVIAVHRATEALRAGMEPAAGDDAKSAQFVRLRDLDELAKAGRLTSGLAGVVRSVHKDHLLGL